MDSQGAARPAVEDVPPPPRPASDGARILQAAFSYFMVILTLGWVLGPVRDFSIRSGADPLLAVLCQSVATLLLLIWAAGWVVEAFGVPSRTGARLMVGLGAVGLVLACDLTTGFLLNDMTPLDFASQFAGREGIVVGLSLALAAALPAFRDRR